MTERIKENRAMVGVPFYDGEDFEVLEACLRNLDSCLNYLGIDAEIVIGINGPRVSSGQDPISHRVSKSQYNADVKFVRTPPGIVEAEKAIGLYAAEKGCRRIFLTDADISRLPGALKNMWDNGDRPVIGANYCAYPCELLIGSGINITPEEMAFMMIFEADKHPLAREFTDRYRPLKRLKGSLLLVDTCLVQTMFGGQNVTSDSRMNTLVPESDRQLIPNAAFMHFARVSITDHIQARLRHFRAAALGNDLRRFTQKSLIYEPDIADDIAKKIVEKYPHAAGVASAFLWQCALRYKVADICRVIASGKKYEPEAPVDLTSGLGLTSCVVSSFKEAFERVPALLSPTDWGALDSPITRGEGTTNNHQSRVPLDLDPFLKSATQKRVILDHLGLDEKAEI